MYQHIGTPYRPAMRLLSGLGADVPPTPNELKSQIDVSAAQSYNRRSAAENTWSVASSAGGLTPGSEVIAVEVAMFQYAIGGHGARIDGKLGPKTLKALREFQRTNYYSYTDRRAYGISLAQHIVIGASSADFAMAAKYNKGEAGRNVFSLVGSYYDGPDDPKLAADIAYVQKKHGLKADGRMTAETAALFVRLIREGGDEGKSISGSFRFAGVEPGPGVDSSSSSLVVNKKRKKRESVKPADALTAVVESPGVSASGPRFRSSRADEGGMGKKVAVVAGLAVIVGMAWYYTKNR